MYIEESKKLRIYFSLNHNSHLSNSSKFFYDQISSLNRIFWRRKAINYSLAEKNLQEYVLKEKRKKILQKDVFLLLQDFKLRNDRLFCKRKS